MNLNFSVIEAPEYTIEFGTEFLPVCIEFLDV